MSDDEKGVLVLQEALEKERLEILGKRREALKEAVLSNARLEALKIAASIALGINHFERRYDNGMPGLLKDIDLLHEIADHNLKYIMGEK